MGRKAEEICGDRAQPKVREKEPLKVKQVLRVLRSRCRERRREKGTKQGGGDNAGRDNRGERQRQEGHRSTNIRRAEEGEPRPG